LNLQATQFHDGFIGAAGQFAPDCDPAPLLELGDVRALVSVYVRHGDRKSAGATV
jgi:hypothetical protein